MPELPEVETVRRYLQKRLKGRTVDRVEVANLSAVDKKKGLPLNRLAGCQVLDVERRGKHLLLHFSPDLTLIAHLKMTGSFVFAHNMEKHAHVLFHLRDGCTLAYCDIRKFGFLHLLKTNGLDKCGYLAKLGPDALEIGLAVFRKRISSARRKIKTVLLDQAVLAGLGNIYVDEILYAAKVHPLTPANAIPAKQLALMHREMKSILKDSIRNRGTTISDYRGADGKPGDFQNHLRVYGQEKCSRCRGKIQKIVCGSRGTHFCPKCQRSV